MADNQTLEIKDYKGNVTRSQKDDGLKNLETDLDFLARFWDDIPVFDK